MSGRLTRFLGDTPWRVFFRLLVISFIVGLVLSVLNVEPMQVYRWIERVVERFWDMGFELFGRALEYLIVGALIVVPIFILMRLFRLGAGGSRGSE
jgi:hypothetical protein